MEKQTQALTFAEYHPQRKSFSLAVHVQKLVNMEDEILHAGDRNPMPTKQPVILKMEKGLGLWNLIRQLKP